jgi:hypothetical protein
MVRAVDAAGNESANSNAQALVTSGNMDVPYTTANANLTTVDWKTHDLLVDGNLGIGLTNTMGYKLAVNGGAIGESVRVKLHTNWPDFVFVGNYDLPDLTEVERHIHEQGHLIGIPSATEMQAEGIDLGDMNARLLQKIEELTLYILQQDKRIQNLEEDKRKL